MFLKCGVQHIVFTMYFIFCLIEYVKRDTKKDPEMSFLK